MLCLFCIPASAGLCQGKVLLDFQKEAKFVPDSLLASQMEAQAWDLRDLDPDSSFAIAAAALEIAIDSKAYMIAAYCLTDLANAYKHRGLFDSAEIMLQRSILLRDKAGTPSDKAGGRNNLGWLRLKQDQPAKAIKDFDDGLRLLSGAANPSLSSALLEGKGLAYQRIGDNKRALQTFEHALEMNLSRGDSIAIAKTLNNLGNFFQTTGRPVPAAAYYRRALDIYIHQENELGIAQTDMNLGIIELQSGNHDLAIEHLRASQKRCEQRGFEQLLNDVFNNLALALKETGHLEEAEHYHQRDYAYCLRNGLKENAAKAALNIAEMNLDAHAYASAYRMSKEAERLSVNNAKLRLEVYSVRSAALAGMGDFEGAFAWSTRQRTLDDSITEAISTVQNLADKYLQEKVQRIKAEEKAKANVAELARLDAENNLKTILFWGLIVISAITFIAGLLFLRGQKFRIQKLVADALLVQMAANEEKRIEAISRRLQDAEVEALRKSMLTQEQERRRIAENLHDRLGSKLSVVQMHFQSLQKHIEFRQEKGEAKFIEGIRYLDESCQEVREIARSMGSGDLSHFGLQLALERFCGQVEQIANLQISFEATGTPTKLPATVEADLYSILRTAIENILRHAQATRFSLTIAYKKQSLAIRLADNGKGFEVKDVAAREGMGLKNIARRIEDLGGELELESKIGEGTVITLSIPC